MIAKTEYHIETPPIESLEEKMRHIARKVIPALREALAEQPAQQEPVEYWTVADGWVSEQAEVPAFVWVEPDFWEHCKHVNCGTAYRLPAPGRQPLYTSPPAQRKPLTDDPLQGAVDWLLEADGEYFCTATVQRTLRIGYNRAKRLCDTAKERAAHGIKENT